MDNQPSSGGQNQILQNQEKQSMSRSSDLTNWLDDDLSNFIQLPSPAKNRLNDRGANQFQCNQGAPILNDINLNDASEYLFDDTTNTATAQHLGNHKRRHLPEINLVDQNPIVGGLQKKTCCNCNCSQQKTDTIDSNSSKQSTNLNCGASNDLNKFSTRDPFLNNIDMSETNTDFLLAPDSPTPDFDMMTS